MKKDLSKGKVKSVARLMRHADILNEDVVLGEKSSESSYPVSIPLSDLTTPCPALPCNSSAR